MKRSAIVFGAAAAVITASAVYAADAGVTNAYFEINGASVHELNGSSVNCNIKTDGKEGSAVMLCAVYDKTSNALKSMKVVSGANGSYSGNVSVSDADNSYVTMCLWNSMAGGRPISQVYALYPKDPAPENPWKVNEDTTGAITFSWEECEDNLKTAGYKVYKNGTMVQNSNSLSYTDFEEKWYSAKENEYKITAYDEYGNESSGTEFKNVAIDKTNMAAVHFMTPEKSEKMSLYLATNKENDPSWYGYYDAYKPSH